MLVTVRAVFGARYIAMAVAVTGAMLFGLLLLSEFLFLEPYVIGHIPPGTEVGFVLILAISVLSGLVIPMNVYRIVLLRGGGTKVGGGVLGSLVGAVAGTLALTGAAAAHRAVCRRNRRRSGVDIRVSAIVK